MMDNNIVTLLELDLPESKRTYSAHYYDLFDRAVENFKVGNWPTSKH